MRKNVVQCNGMFSRVPYVQVHLYSLLSAHTHTLCTELQEDAGHAHLPDAYHKN
jgi:hypothetical protein